MSKSDLPPASNSSPEDQIQTLWLEIALTTC